MRTEPAHPPGSPRGSTMTPRRARGNGPAKGRGSDGGARAPSTPHCTLRTNRLRLGQHAGLQKATAEDATLGQTPQTARGAGGVQAGAQHQPGLTRAYSPELWTRRPSIGSSRARRLGPPGLSPPDLCPGPVRTLKLNWSIMGYLDPSPGLPSLPRFWAAAPGSLLNQ